MSEETQSEKSSARKVWWAVIGAFALMLSVLGWIYLFADVEPPDLAHYGVNSKPVPVGENPLVEFAKETAGLRQSMRDDWEKRYREDDKLAAFESGCEKALREHIEGHREILTQFWQIADQVKSPLRYPSEVIDNQTGCTLALQDAFVLISRHIKLLILTKRNDEALMGALALAEIAGKLCAADVTVVPCAVQVTAQFNAFNSILRALPGATLNDDALSTLISRLHQTEVSAINVSKVLRRSAFAQSSWLRECKNRGQLGPGWLGEMSQLEMMLFKPNESSWEALHLMLPVANGLDKGWQSGWRASEELQKRATTMGHPTQLWDQIRPNRPGRWLAATLQSAEQYAVRRALQSIVMCRSLQIAMSIRAFDLATGKLPESLEDLVPAFLPAMLPDPVTGLSFKWVPETGLIYSVGTNGKDDGGSFDPEKNKTADKDWGMVYPWRNPKGGH